MQVLWLDKSTGKVCLSIASNGLAITGIDDRRYWSRIPTADSRSGVIMLSSSSCVLTLFLDYTGPDIDIFYCLYIDTCVFRSA